MSIEAAYQAKLIKRLKREFPGCMIIINDPSRNQGIPDLLILFNQVWFTLEVKKSENAPIQPNQEYYIRMLNDMSFACFIWPEIEDEVFDALQSTFGAVR